MRSHIHNSRIEFVLVISARYHCSSLRRYGFDGQLATMSVTDEFVASALLRVLDSIARCAIVVNAASPRPLTTSDLARGCINDRNLATAAISQDVKIIKFRGRPVDR